jgi:rod shape-determining protein MreC
MQKLLYFLYRFRTFGLFLLLEVVCGWLIISYNNRQNASVLNSSNFIIASINTLSNNTSDYFDLSRVNDELIEENLKLRRELSKYSLFTAIEDTSEVRYSWNKAHVINNTYRRSLNYLTINAGSDRGVKPGMGVVSSKGVVGQVKSVSSNFATVTSLLHRNLLISSIIKSSNTLCTIQWDGGNHQIATLKYVPRHIELVVGDEVVTSGYNAVFPAGIAIGTVSEVNLSSNDVFYFAKIKLKVDFSSLSHVYLVENILKIEQDSLELQTRER